MKHSIPLTTLFVGFPLLAAPALAQDSEPEPQSGGVSTVQASSAASAPAPPPQPTSPPQPSWQVRAASPSPPAIAVSKTVAPKPALPTVKPTAPAATKVAKAPAPHKPIPQPVSHAKPITPSVTKVAKAPAVAPVSKPTVQTTAPPQAPTVTKVAKTPTAPVALKPNPLKPELVPTTPSPRLTSSASQPPAVSKIAKAPAQPAPQIAVDAIAPPVIKVARLPAPAQNPLPSQIETVPLPTVTKIAKAPEPAIGPSPEPTTIPTTPANFAALEDVEVVAAIPETPPVPNPFHHNAAQPLLQVAWPPKRQDVGLDSEPHPFGQLPVRNGVEQKFYDHNLGSERSPVARFNATTAPATATSFSPQPGQAALLGATVAHKRQFAYVPRPVAVQPQPPASATTAQSAEPAWRVVETQEPAQNELAQLDSPSLISQIPTNSGGSGNNNNDDSTSTYEVWSYIMAGGNIGVDGVDQLSQAAGTFGAKIGITPFLSVRPNVWVGNDTTAAIALTLDVPREDLDVAGASRILPFAGAGVLFNTSNNTRSNDVTLFLKAGIDTLITRNIVFTTSTNISVNSSDTDIGIVVGFGHSF